MIDYQNWYETTLTSPITNLSTNIPLNVPPTVSEGVLVLDYDIPAKREVIHYTSKDATSVTVPATGDSYNAGGSGRGCEQTTARAHDQNAKVRMLLTGGLARQIQLAAAVVVNQNNNGGWVAATNVPTSVIYNGNRSYDLVFNGVDVTGTYSNGMRLKATRTVAAPTQCASLNGTSQSFSKTAPAGMTWTDDFVAGAWVKLSAYNGFRALITRYNSANGWELSMNGNGQVYIAGYNGASGNNKTLITTQSIPLNKWVHIAAQLDMSAITGSNTGLSPTTNYIMFDGVDVPCSSIQSGSNPTLLVQAGNLEIGSVSGGNVPFPGKIAQAFVTSAKLTQAQVRSIYSQGLTSADMATYNIVSAYSLSGATGANDINTINANNLTPNNGALTTIVDAPWTQNDTTTPDGLTDCAIVTKKVFSTNSTITVQVPEGCTLPTSGGISSLSFSSSKVPYGFPASRLKWAISYILLASYTAGTSTAYAATPAQLNHPVGEWKATLRGDIQAVHAGGDSGETRLTLSTSGTTETDKLSTIETYSQATGASTTSILLPLTTDSDLSLTTATVVTLLYLNTGGGNVILAGNLGAVLIRSELAYL